MKQVVSLVIVSVFIISLGCFVEAKDNGKAEQPVAFPQNVIAMVNEDVISDAELRERLSAKHKNVSEITSDSVEEALDDLINRRLIMQEAYRMGLDEDPLIVHDREKFIRIQSIIRFRGDFLKEAKVSKEEVLDAITEEHEKREVEMLFFKDEEQAEKAYSLVQNGRKLESFKDEATYWSGELSRKTYGKSSPVTEAVFKSKVGELLLVKSNEGTFVVDVQGEINVSQEARKRLAPDTESQLRKKKYKQNMQDLLDKMRKEAVVTVNEELLNNLNSEELLKGEDWELDSREIATLNDEPITVGLFLQKYRAYLPRTKRFEHTQEENNKRALEIAIMTSLEAQAASARGYYEKSAELKTMVKKHQDRVMLNLFYNRVILPRIDPSEENLKKYYRENIKIFSNPDKVALKIILVKEEEKANEILRELRKGANINYLFERYSLPHTLDGWRVISELPGEMAREVRTLDVGEISNVILSGEFFFIAKVVGREEGEPYIFSSVRRAVMQRFTEQRGRELLREMAAILREKSEIKVNRSLLADIEKSLLEKKPQKGSSL